MFVLEVIPLSRTAPPQPLSYRSSAKVSIGTIVSVPLRKKTVPGLVVDCVPVREAKAQLKTASFSLSRSSSETLGTLPSVLLMAARKIAEYHATTLGAVLSALLVPVLSESLPERLVKGSAFEIEPVELPMRARMKRYVDSIGKEKGTTLIVVPTQIEADQWGTLLKTHKPLILSGKLTGKKREAAIARACGAGAPALIISTPGFSWIPIPHLSRIIIERVSAGSYSLPKRPYLNLIYALTELARARNIPLIYGDYPLPLEYRANPKKPLKEKPAGKISILDTRSEKKEVRAISSDASVVWKAVPDELRKEIKKTIDAGGRAAVLAVRRGYAPTVVCRDCGTAVTDSYGRNLSLVTLKGERVFRSTDGTTIESAKALCKNCGSWNLIPLGIGVERVEEELKAAFPKTSILRLDQDSLSSRSPSAKLLASISEPGTILIGTESMLTLLSPEHPVDLGVIASADALLALPFWRSRERFVRIGLMFAERTNQFIVATRHEEEDAVLSALTSPTTSKFWEEELGMRKALKYPPFGTLIVFQVEGTSARIEDARTAITAASAPFTPIHLAPRSISNTNLRAVSVLHLPENAWPDSSLSERIAQLSPAIRVHIDSESLW